MKKTILIILAAILIIGLGTWGYLYWKKSKSSPAEKDLQEINEASDILNKSAAQGVLPSINPQETNPLKNAPDLNPVSKTNPFKNIKTNPFE